MDIASTIKFRDICKMLESVKAAKNTRRKEIVLKRYYESFCKHRLSFRQKNGVTAEEPEDGNSSFYAVLRLLIPAADRARNNYGLQITALGKLYTRVLQLAKESDDAKRLMFQSWSTFRDYADVIYAVLLPRCHNEASNLTLQQIHEMLDLIANEDTSVKEREIVRFAELASPMEQKWLIRLLLKSMGLGIGEQHIFNLLHAQAKDMYQRCTDLQRICKLLADDKLSVSITAADTDKSAIDLNAFVEPFQQIRPMLCERFPGKIEQLMQTDVLYLETKMDGERFQLHFARGKFKYISRNGVDYTKSFGDSYDFGSLTPNLRTLLPLDMVSIILDGEMMIWDAANSRYRQKGENTNVKHLKSDGNLRPCFVVYDLLYLNGESMLNYAYVQRVYKMRKLLNEQQGVLQLMKSHKINSLEHFNTLFQQLLEAHAEGIVIKKQNSVYQPGVRTGGGWYKDKADYIKGLITEFDVLIMGGFYNRKKTFIETFLLGVLKRGSGNKHDEVYSIGCVSNNTRQRSLLLNQLQPHWHSSSAEPPPLWFHYKANEKEGAPDVWIRPDKSIILQVKAADLTPNNAFFTPKCLHFARTQLVRDDKVWNECMTLQEYTDLCQDRVAIKKLNKRHLDLYDFAADRKRQKLTPANPLGVYEKRYDNRPLENVSELLNGFSFCILSGMRGFSKQSLQTLVAQNGGTIVQNPIPNDPKCVCLSGDQNYLAERLMQQQPRTIDILRTDWILRVCKNREIELRLKDVLSATQALQTQLDKSFDKLGDSFADTLSSVEDLQELLQDISETVLDSNQVKSADLDKIELELLGVNSINIFSKHSACFYKPDANDLNRLLFKQHGGQLVTDLENITPKYIFVFPDQLQLLDFKQWHLKYFNSRAVEIVNADWIYQSHQANCALSITEHLLESQ